jgi:hypothetical protein
MTNAIKTYKGAVQSRPKPRRSGRENLLPRGVMLGDENVVVELKGGDAAGQITRGKALADLTPIRKAFNGDEPLVLFSMASRLVLDTVDAVCFTRAMPKSKGCLERVFIMTMENGTSNLLKGGEAGKVTVSPRMEVRHLRVG